MNIQKFTQKSVEAINEDVYKRQAFSRTALVRNIIFSFTNADDAEFWCDLVCVQCLYFFTDL